MPNKVIVKFIHIFHSLLITIIENIYLLPPLEVVQIFFEGWQRFDHFVSFVLRRLRGSHTHTRIIFLGEHFDSISKNDCKFQRKWHGRKKISKRRKNRSFFAKNLLSGVSLTSTWKIYSGIYKICCLLALKYECTTTNLL